MPIALSTRKLTVQQVTILKFIYLFRFISTKHLQLKLSNKQLPQTQRRLNILITRGYIGRNYTNRDRLNGRYASYYLTPLGMKALKQNGVDADPRVLHAIYKDKNASERFIAHCIFVGDVWHALKTKYDELVIFSPKSALVGHEYFPQEAKPDAYIRYKTKLGKGSRTEQYLLYVCEEAIPLFVHKRTIKQILAYVDEGEWDETKGKLPTMLLVCDSDRLKTKIKRAITKAMDDAYLDEEDVGFEVRTISELS